MYVQALINLFHVFQSQRFEPLKQFVRLSVAALYEPEILPRLPFHLFVRLVVEANVEVVNCVDASVLDFIPVAPVLISAYQFAELRSVVAEMIYAHRIVAEKFENFVQRTAYNCGGKMPDVKGLGDIYRRIVDADSLARTDGRPAVILPFIGDFLNNFA